MKVTLKRIDQRLIMQLGLKGQSLGGNIKHEIQQMAAAGMDKAGILDALKREMSIGGRFFGMLSRGFEGAAGGAVNYVSQDAAHEAWQGADAWTWISVADENRCEDCADLHGQTKTWAEWEAAGLPGAGATRCGWRCRCELVPEAADDIGGPITKSEIEKEVPKTKTERIEEEIVKTIHESDVKPGFKLPEK